MKLCLIPKPRFVQESEGSVRLPRVARVYFSLSGAGLEPSLLEFCGKLLARHGLVWRVSAANMEAESFLKVKTAVSGIAPQGYRLLITHRDVRVEAADEAGAFYGLQTLLQILVQYGNELPCLRVEDHPALPVRGFMLDISRCKVPTLESILALVDLLAEFKYNQFQLYIEHTFAFPGHQEVWAKASPLTGEEIRRVDEHCRVRHIDLVPNFNSFGHFERWLRHPRYFTLAECPKGFSIPELEKYSAYGSTLKPTVESLRFLKTLYDGFLPHFGGNKFNIGGDEPWELGQGASRERVQREGKHRVYLDFLKGILEQSWKMGRQPLFWADILLERPDLVHEVPEYAVPVVWGYEQGHPFQEQCGMLAGIGRGFYVAPGTSAWNSFTGRLPNMLANVREAAEAAVAAGGQGVLLTSWGDGGHHQPWPVVCPGILAGASAAWLGGGEISEAELAEALSLFVFRENSGKLAACVLGMGKTDALAGWSKKNRSLVFDLFFADNAKLSALMRTLEMESFKQAKENLERSRESLGEAAPATEEGALCLGEVRLGCDMGLWAMERGLNLLNASGCVTTPDLLKQFDGMIGRFETYWRRRNRPGGMEESLGLMWDVRRHVEARPAYEDPEAKKGGRGKAERTREVIEG